MKIYFVTNDRWYSRLTRWLFKEEPTHVGLGFDVDCAPMVLDISKPTGSLYHYDYWFGGKYRLVSTFDIPFSKEDEREAFHRAIATCVNTPYDWPAYYYGIFRGILFRLFGVPLPKTNPFATSDQGLCTECFADIRMLLSRYHVYMVGIDLAARTPGMLEKLLIDEGLSPE